MRPGLGHGSRSPNPFGTMKMHLFILLLSSLLLVGGCASPTVHSVDSKANYGYVFGDVTALEPTIVHSHVERERGSVLGIFPLDSQHNGNWQFELLTSNAWLDQVKSGFVEIPFSEVWPGQMPDWFSPTSEEFTAWKMQATSSPNAYLFIERKPLSTERIRVFIRRH